jgi:hypothetical protein
MPILADALQDAGCENEEILVLPGFQWVNFAMPD